MENIKEYIIDILDNDDIRVEAKDGIYHITKIYDSKKSDTLNNLFQLIKLTDKLTIESKLKTISAITRDPLDRKTSEEQRTLSQSTPLSSAETFQIRSRVVRQHYFNLRAACIFPRSF
jgi:DNA replication protein DnaD